MENLSNHQRLELVEEILTKVLNGKDHINHFFIKKIRSIHLPEYKSDEWIKSILEDDVVYYINLHSSYKRIKLTNDEDSYITERYIEANYELILKEYRDKT